MPWRRLSFEPKIGAGPPPWRPWFFDAHNPPFRSGSLWRKQTLCKVIATTYFNGGEVSSADTGFIYDSPFQVTSGGSALNQPDNVTAQSFTLVAANIGAPWMLVWEDVILSTEEISDPEYDIRTLVVVPGGTYEINYNAGLNTSRSFYRGMLCVPA